MSEKLRGSHEYEAPKHEDLEHARKNLESHHEKAAKETRHEHKESIDKILEKVEREAKKSESIRTHEHHEKPKHESRQPVNNDLKKHALDRSLKKVQNKLPAAERQFSKFIHKPAVDAISEVAGKTIARPSSLLLGGVLSVVFSLGIMIISRYYGYRYNFLVGLAAFAGGFLLGYVIDGFIRLKKR